MTNDMINGFFEFCGAIACLMSVRAVVKDRCWAGVSPWNLVFFTTWGIFNLFYYPSLHQVWSFRGGCFLSLANLVYIGSLCWFPHRPMKTPGFSS